MRKARDLLRLCLGNGLSGRQAAQSLGISTSTASVYLRRAQAAGLDWAAAAEMDEVALERALAAPAVTAAKERPMPDVAYLKQELAKPDMTVALLWADYKAEYPDGYQYYVEPGVMERSARARVPRRRVRRDCFP